MLQTIIAATDEPVTVADAKAHLRVTHSSDDALIGRLITSAREWLESYTGRAMVEASYRYIGKAAKLPLWPASVTLVKGLESNDTWTAVDIADFIFDADRNYLVETSYSTRWIEFTTAPGIVPQSLADAILFRVQADYEGDADSADKFRSAASGMAWPHRVNLGV